MRDSHKLTKELESRIKDAIKKALSARHVPSYIFEVEDIPVRTAPFDFPEDVTLSNNLPQYTVNGKKIEIAVKQIVSGSNLTPSGTVANPESLKLYYKYRDIEALTAKARL